MSAAGFAVVDLETTGLSPRLNERIVEIAVVHADPDGTITGEWETLVNPRRHVGAELVHGIRAADLLDAPTFGEIAADVVELLQGRVLVAHNARFDRSFLTAELQTAQMPLPEEAPTLCTMALARELVPGSGRSLADCCAAFDIELKDAHRALSDAHSTAELLGCLIASTDRGFWQPSLEKARTVDWPGALSTAGTRSRKSWVRRHDGSATLPFLQRIAQGLPDLSGPTEHQEYLAMLDRCLMDRHISEHESRELAMLAQELGVGRDTAAMLHAGYLDQLATVAWADGLLSTAEVTDLAAVAELLQVSDELLTSALTPRADLSDRAKSPAVIGTTVLAPGSAIVLTGEMASPRSELEAALEAAGYRVAAAVSKKVALLVAADPDSLSGKARKARDYGIPVVGESYLKELFRVA